MRYEALLARRVLAEPMQYILGEQEFYGLRFRVTPAVLIPRPETEHLVDAVADWAPKDKPVRIVDVGTGSGAIAVALAHLLPLARVDAVDLSESALEVARGNARAHGVADRVRFQQSDLLTSVRNERFDVVVSNPPYVARSEQLEPQVMEWEPHIALFAGKEGMDVYRRLVPAAGAVLQCGGLLALELGAGQAPLLQALLEVSGCWGEPEFLRDLQGIKRLMTAERF